MPEKEVRKTRGKFVHIKHKENFEDWNKNAWAGKFEIRIERRKLTRKGPPDGTG